MSHVGSERADAPRHNTVVPDVSVVSVSWNTAHCLPAAIDSVVRGADPLAVEVIVVDNGSQDGSVGVFERRSDVDLVALDENTGFTRAANVGVIAREPLANGLLAGKYGRDSAWDKGDIRARMPRPYLTQLAEVAERVKDLAGQAGVTPAQLALRFVLDNEAVSVVIVGMKTVAQVEDNLSLE